MTPAKDSARLMLPAPAKINLALCIGQARDDGFHGLVSVFQAVDVHDIVTLVDDPGSPEIRVTATDPEVPVDARNTAHRAASLLRDAHASGRGVCIHLEKRIPSEAGLGGGSSDAAAVLRGLDRLWGLGLSRGQLLPIAAEVGSDVPFFLADGCALVRGRGEQVEPLPYALDAHLVIVKPQTGVSTARAYRDLDAMRARAILPEGEARAEPFPHGSGSAGASPSGLPRCGRVATPPDGAEPAPSEEAVARMCAALRSGDLAQVAAALTNDLEAPAMAAYPEIARLKAELLAAGAIGALLSGSGSAVFGLFASGEAAASAAREMASRWPWVREARPWREL